MKPEENEVSTTDDAVERQPDLFSGEDFARGKPRSRTPTRKPRKDSAPELDETIREVLDREFKSPPPNGADAETPTVFDEADWLPARMLNEFVYCPRLFFYEHVDGIFVHNADTERGKDIHSRVDKGSGALPAPEAAEPGTSANGDTPSEIKVQTSDSENIHSRSVQMGSARLGVSAKLDLVESDGEAGEISPVDYKAGSPREGAEANELWPADRMQLGLHMLILRENGYSCRRGFIYYRGTKQRVPLEWDDDLERWLGRQVAEARALLRSRVRPDPLNDSPKCPRCSLVSVCMPDETRFLRTQESEGEADDSINNQQSTINSSRPRRLIAARDDSRALYLNTQGLRVGIRDRVIDVKEKDRTIEQIRLTDVHHVALFGNIQVSTQAVQQLCREEIPLTYFSTGGWFYGITRGHSLANILLRRAQFRTAENPAACLELARRFVSGKIRNARKMLMRNALVQPLPALQRLKRASHDALEAESAESLLGVEGAAAAAYFAEFGGMLKTDDDDLPGLETPAAAPALQFDFRGRNRRPPTDPVNALLSFAYSLLVKDCTVALLAVGFDPWMGFYHQPRPGRPALSLDLMEEFRPLIAESSVLTAINNRMVGPADFVRAGEAVNLSPAGRKKFLHAYEQRMNHLIIHPIFDYKVSYRRALELQARLLARVLEGEIPHYTPFLTR
jgi:CRISPR-associated protein Cas1